MIGKEQMKSFLTYLLDFNTIKNIGSFDYIFEQFCEVTKDIIDCIVDNQQKNIEDSNCLIELFDYQNNHYLYKFTKNISDYSSRVIIPHDESLPHKLDLNNNVKILDNIQNIFPNNEYKSGISIPLIYNNKHFGYFIILKENEHLNNQEIEICKLISSYVQAAFTDVFNDIKSNMLIIDKQVALETKENEIKNMKEFQSIIFDNLNEALLIFGTDGVIIDCNTVSEDLFGYKKEEIIGSTIKLLIGSSNKSHVLSEIYNAISQGNNFSGEIIFSNKENNKKVYEINLTPIRREDGVTIAIVSLGRDVTNNYIQQYKQKQNIKALENDIKEKVLELELFKKVLDDVGDAVVIYEDLNNTRERKIIYVNKAFQKITGYTKDEVIGKNPSFLLKSNRNVDAIKKACRYIKKGIKTEINLLQWSKNEEELSSNWAVTPVADSQGNYKYCIAVQN